MIVNDDDAKKRLESPLNLINRLRNSSSRSSAMSLFGIGRKEDKREEIKEVKVSFNPFQPQASSSLSVVPQSTILEPPTKLNDILENSESQIKLGLAHDRALELLNRSVSLLSEKLDDIRADKLPTVVGAASKVVESIRRERNEASKNNKDREVHYHFYTPQQNKLSDYEVIDVGGEALEEGRA